MLRASATELARGVREGRWSSTELVEGHIAQIRRINPTLNALVADRFALARREAAEADAHDPVGLLHGVPCSIKECFAVEGMPNCSGLYRRRDHVATQDATAVARYRAAGAIVMGVTNVSELCMWMESDNRVYGRTNNPYDPTRIVGGSSGGEGAIIGAGASPFGLGSDVGGSIRMPAFFNGVFGHKPTGGLVPATGQYPQATGRALKYLTTGPLCRKAEDLMPLLRVLAGPDGRDGECEAMELGDPAAVSFAGRRVLTVPDNGTTPVSAELRRAQDRAAEHFASLGADVQRCRIPLLKMSYDIWGAMLHAHGTESFSELLGNGRPISGTMEMLRWATGRGQHTLPAIVLAAFEWTADFPRGRGERFVKLGEQLRAELAREMGEDGILLFPSYAQTAPKHHAPLLRPLQWVYTAILNVMMLPATQTPLGLDRRGLPLGVQVVGPHGRDELCIAGALELERAFGGWVPPAMAGR